MKAIYVVDRSVRNGHRLACVASGSVPRGRAVGIGQGAQHVFAVLSTKDFTFEAAIVPTEEVADDVAHAIVREAARWRADAILMGTHGQRGVARWMLGTVSGRVTELTEVPVLLSRRRPFEAIQNA